MQRPARRGGRWRLEGGVVFAVVYCHTAVQTDPKEARVCRQCCHTVHSSSSPPAPALISPPPSPLSSSALKPSRVWPSCEVDEHGDLLEYGTMGVALGEQGVVTICSITVSLCCIGAVFLFRTAFVLLPPPTHTHTHKSRVTGPRVY